MSKAKVAKKAKKLTPAAEQLNLAAKLMANLDRIHKRNT